jgi:lipid A 4'-phosphatase
VETKAILALAVLTALVSIPAVDNAVSAFFFSGGFSWDPHGLLEFARAAVPTMILGSILFFVLVWMLTLRSKDWIWGMSTRRVLYLAATAVLGPGLLVETLFKPHWGRARPKDIAAFGGDHAYTSPFVMVEECTRNCSFVSGHAAIAFWVTAYAFLLPKEWRTAGLWAGVGFGLGVGMVRVVQGAHFASDVAAAGLMVVAVNTLAARLMLERS